jgi:hypothetical protein
MLHIVENIGKSGAKCKCNSCGKLYIVKDKYSNKKTPIGNLCTSCKNILINMHTFTQTDLQKVFYYDEITGNLFYRITCYRANKGSIATTPHTRGYLQTRIGKKAYLAHRIIFMYMQGYMPIEIDHIDHNRSNNVWTNLREISPRDNHLNESLSKNSTTGITGVCLHAPTGKYRAYIMVHRKHIHLGLYENIADAQAARQYANTRYGFHENHGQ